MKKQEHYSKHSHNEIILETKIINFESVNSIARNFESVNSIAKTCMGVWRILQHLPLLQPKVFLHPSHLQ